MREPGIFVDESAGVERSFAEALDKQGEVLVFAKPLCVQDRYAARQLLQPGQPRLEVGAPSCGDPVCLAVLPCAHHDDGHPSPQLDEPVYDPETASPELDLHVADRLAVGPVSERLAIPASVLGQRCCVYRA